MQEIISRVVDESSVVDKNKELVKTALIKAIRDIIYNGTVEQKKYFKSPFQYLYDDVFVAMESTNCNILWVNGFKDDSLCLYIHPSSCSFRILSYARKS